MRSLANLTRADGEAFVRVAARTPIGIEARRHAPADVNRALDDLREGRLSGAAVLVPGEAAVDGRPRSLTIRPAACRGHVGGLVGILILFLHLLGATVWTGGHLVLAIAFLPRALRLGDPGIVRAFEERYERVGVPALLLQVVTGVWLAVRWVPDVGAWFAFGSPQAALVSTKLGLLILTLGLAAHARLRIVPRLTAQTLPVLAAHVVLVTLLAVAFVFVGIGFRTGGLF